MPIWSQCSVLVVDDSALQREFVVSLLHELGFVEILQANNGVQALQILEQHENSPVDFVLSDLDMPGMDGIELMREIAEKGWAHNLVMMTARDPRLLDAVESMALEDKNIHLLGALRKPLTRNQLSHVLAMVRPEGSPDTANEIAQFSREEVEEALRAGQLIPWYQPQIDIKQGQIKGVEALARWIHPEKGVILPARFIPILENDGLLMREFTYGLFAQVLSDLAAWKKQGMTVTASVNLSMQSLLDSTLADRLADLTNKAQIPVRYLVLEVTETMVMNNLSTTLGNLARLRLKGFGLSMDDYGVGYSSMQQLSRCPFTELKIDRAFVNEASSHPNLRVILESSIEMGKRLKATTVAEGVEQEDDWRLLQELGCELGQGYFAARPMPAAELINWYSENRQRLSTLFN